MSLLVSKTGFAFLSRNDRFDTGPSTLLNARLGHLVPALALWVGEKFRTALANLIGDAQVLCMVGDGDPIERTVRFEAHTVVHDDLPACSGFKEGVGC